MLTGVDGTQGPKFMVPATGAIAAIFSLSSLPIDSS